MSGIFISYRRDDSAPYAGRLYDRLGAHFGTDQVFMDVDDIPPGVNFLSQIESTIQSCDALLAVIGKNWLSARDADGKLRLSDPADIVSAELALALKRRILVIPVLVGGSKMPAADELPDALRDLAYRNAVVLSDDDFQLQVGQVIQALQKVPGLRKEGRTRDAVAQRRALRSRNARSLVAPALILLASAGLWWQSQGGSLFLNGSTTSSEPAKSASMISGEWAGNVTYSWGPTYRERFMFHAEGDTLFGTASFLGLGRGIEDGKIDADKVFFNVRFQEVLGEHTMERKNRYTGTLVASELHVRMQDDKGSPPIEFRLSKLASPIEVK